MRIFDRKRMEMKIKKITFFKKFYIFCKKIIKITKTKKLIFLNFKQYITSIGYFTLEICNNYIYL